MDAVRIPQALIYDHKLDAVVEVSRVGAAVVCSCDEEQPCVHRIDFYARLQSNGGVWAYTFTRTGRRTAGTLARLFDDGDYEAARAWLLCHLKISELRQPV